MSRVGDARLQGLHGLFDETQKISSIPSERPADLLALYPRLDPTQHAICASYPVLPVVRAEREGVRGKSGHCGAFVWPKLWLLYE